MDGTVATKMIAAGASITPLIVESAKGDTLLLLERAMEWSRLLEIALLIKPLNLHVLIVLDVYKTLPCYFKHVVSMQCAWNVLREIKQR